MARSIRIVCTGLIVAFTVGLGSTAASNIVAGPSAVQRTVTASGFDWDSVPAAPPAQS
ncbi:hypothetical protein [Kitasatospora sp. NPDC059571]|uniref:hypothetical protein n=1 Tax=Kitasatospora sp. NPDC059571 TaxID=3346871 RepID=UPI00368FC0B3